MGPTDGMYTDPDRGRDAVSAAVAGLDARRTAAGDEPPPLTAASFGQGLGEKGTAVAGLLAGAHGVRRAHLDRLGAGLDTVASSLRGVDVADTGSADRLGAVRLPGGDR